MKVVFGRILGERLDYANCETILSLFESKNFFSGRSTLLLFPLKNFFDVTVLDNGHAFVVIEKPLNNIGNGIKIDVASGVTLQRREVKRRLVDVICLIGPRL